jgi:hypothetical protein
VETNLEATGLRQVLQGGGNWRNLPFRLSTAEEADLQGCLRLARLVPMIVNGVSEFSADSTRQELEAILRRNPNHFYAEYLLGLWHDLAGQAEEGREYHARALAHAPVVLVQTYRFPDGQPLRGAALRHIEIECNRVQGGSIDPSLKLAFYHLTTDETGSVRLPVYDTVYRRASVPAIALAPPGLRLTYPRLGWFAAPSRVGLLPVAQVKPE